MTSRIEEEQEYTILKESICQVEINGDDGTYIIIMAVLCAKATVSRRLSESIVSAQHNDNG